MAVDPDPAPVLAYARVTALERAIIVSTSPDHYRISVPPPPWPALDASLKVGVAVTASADLLLIASLRFGAATTSQVLVPVTLFAVALIAMVCVALDRLRRHLSFEVTPLMVWARSTGPFGKKGIAWPRSVVREVRLNELDRQLVVCLSDDNTFKVSLGRDLPWAQAVVDRVAGALAAVPPTSGPLPPDAVARPLRLRTAVPVLLLVIVATAAAALGPLAAMVSPSLGLILVAPFVLLLVVGVHSRSPDPDRRNGDNARQASLPVGRA